MDAKLLSLESIRSQIDAWNEALAEIEQKLEAVEARQVAVGIGGTPPAPIVEMTSAVHVLPAVVVKKKSVVRGGHWSNGCCGHLNGLRLGIIGQKMIW